MLRLSDDLVAAKPRKRRKKQRGETVVREEDLKKFWKKVRKGKANECWTWIRKNKNNTDYGRIGIDGKQVGAHRLSYLIHHGEISDDLFVCHTCDNPSCVNPKHLFLGDTADNAHDAMRKGRLDNQKKKVCVRGHKYSGENLSLYGPNKNWKWCKACARIRQRKKYWRDKMNGKIRKR